MIFLIASVCWGGYFYYDGKELDEGRDMEKTLSLSFNFGGLALFSTLLILCRYGDGFFF